MAFINWSDQLSVTIPSIDEQHKRLVGLINDLHAAMSQGKAKDVMGKIFDELVAYTTTHFKTEEQHFEKLNYPKRSPHVLEHQKLTKKALELQASFKAGIAMSMDVLQFLQDWLTHHIQKVDKEYGPFLKSKGVN